MITMKDYASSKKISYEAVRKQVKRYKEELEGHIISDGRQQFLDDVAVAFLDEKRLKNPIIMEQTEKNELIEELEQNYQNLLIKVAEQADKIAKLSEWKADNAIAIAEANQKQLLLEEKSKQIDILEGFLKEANKKLEDFQKEKEVEIKAAEDKAKLNAASEYHKKIEEMKKQSFLKKIAWVFSKEE